MAIPEQLKAFIERTHDILEDREDQIGLNLKAMRGGRPYVDERLARMPYEPDASWSGNRQTDAKGRKERAYMVNYARRAVTKINQYVFQELPKNEGIDPKFAADVTKTRVTLQQFRERVSELLTAAQWCWISVDRSAPSVDEQTGTIRQRSVAEREAVGDRVFWQVWEPCHVRDWTFDAAGQLEWLITEEEHYIVGTAMEPVREEKIRTLWERGQGTRYFISDDENGKEQITARPFTLSAPIVPFIPCGTISPHPHWFDEAEMIQAALLNLESVHHENLFQSVYAQMVLPTDIQQEGHGGDAGTQGGGPMATSGDAIRRVGQHYPIFEDGISKGITRYLQLPADALKLIPEEIQRRKREFFEVVGLAMQNTESRQVASAEAKQWDHLDVRAVLAERASLLEDIERKAVEMSAKIDTAFAVWTPVYSREFDVDDIEQETKALLEMSTLDLPPLARREVMRVAVNLLGKLAPIPPDRVQAMNDEIDGLDMPADLTAIASNPSVPPPAP